MKFTEVPYRYLKEFFLTATGMQYSDSTTYYNVISSVTSGSGSISPSGTYAYLGGTSATYTFSPSAGYEISNVIVDGTSHGVISSYSFTNISTNHTISVEFSEIVVEYTITSSVSSGSGSIDPSGSIVVEQGDSQTYTFTPSEGYEILNVVVDSVSIGASASYTFTNITSNHTISVIYTGISYTIVSSITAGQGAILPAGTNTYSVGASALYNMYPDYGSGYINGEVFVDDVSQGIIDEYTFTNITGNHTISVAFNTMSPSAELELIIPVPDISILVEVASGATLSAGIDLDITDIPSSTISMNLTADNILGQLTIPDFMPTVSVSSGVINEPPVSGSIDLNVVGLPSAAFVDIIGGSFIIESSVTSGSGNILPLGSVVVSAGEDQTFTMTASAGYEINDVFVNSISIGPTASYTFEDVDDNGTIEVFFWEAT